jgi:hypothetical protein
MASFPRVKFDLRRKVLANSRYANSPALYSAFEHDPEKWAPVFRKDHAPAINCVTACQFDKRATDPY